jgi:hypothetical protein
MSHPLDETQKTPWHQEIDRLDQQLKDHEMAEKMGVAENSKVRWFKDPVTVLTVVILQTISITIFLTTMSATLNGVVRDITESKLAQYTKDDARKDRELADTKFLLVQLRNDELVRRIGILEGQTNELLNRARR